MQTMKKITPNISKYKVGRKTSKELDLANTIYKWSRKWSSEKKDFGMFMRWIKLKGVRFVYECYNEARQEGGKNPITKFKWLYGQTTVKYENSPRNASDNFSGIRSK